MKVAESDGAESPWTSWLRCCMPAASSDKRSFHEKQSHDDDDTIYDQPSHYPRPVAVPQMASNRLNKLEKSPRPNAGPKRRRFLNLSSSSRRPIISAPSHFRHITTASPQFDFHEPEPQPEPQPEQNADLRPARQLPRRAFRPLELSIHQADKQPSPLLPHFGVPSELPVPAPVYDPTQTRRRSRSDSAPPKTPEDQLEKPPVRELGSPFSPIRGLKRPADSTPTSSLNQVEKASDIPSTESRSLEHQRSFSSMSFHFPRKTLTGTTDSSPYTVQDEEIPPLIPPRARNRARAQTSPDVEAIKARVASAMLEVERLQQQIDTAIERQSLYANSRPSTPHSMARTIPDMEPMPSIPALPPAAPSFAERLNSEIDRPRTAPIKSHISAHRRANTAGDAPASPHTPPPRPKPKAKAKAKRPESPLQPPLPLVLRPPLRKKKSFSRVSNWLFPGAEHNRDVSFDSVTNLPRPVTGKDGYYQCVSLGETGGRRQSNDTVGTVSTWETNDDQTFPSTWSPSSTAVTKAEEPLISRSATFGRNDRIPRRMSVGIAV